MRRHIAVELDVDGAAAGLADGLDLDHVESERLLGAAADVYALRAGIDICLIARPCLLRARESGRHRGQLRLRQYLVLRPTRSAKHRPIEVPARDGDPAGRRAAHIVEAEDAATAQVGNVERGRAVAGAERRARESE
jgi:hypothetical protein